MVVNHWERKIQAGGELKAENFSRQSQLSLSILRNPQAQWYRNQVRNQQAEK
jgi:hypothetical protein